MTLLLSLFICIFGVPQNDTISDGLFCISYKINSNKKYITVAITKKNTSNDTIISMSNHNGSIFGLDYFNAVGIDSIFNIANIDSKNLTIYSHKANYSIIYPSQSQNYNFKITKNVCSKYPYIVWVESYDIIKNNDYMQYLINNQNSLEANMIVYFCNKSQKTFYIPLWDKRKKK